MYLSRRACDKFVKGNSLPFSIHGRQRNNKDIKPHPDYQIMKKITWPSLPQVTIPDRAHKSELMKAKFEEENLFGMDYILGEEFSQIVEKVENGGFMLVVGYLEFPFDDADYVIEHAISDLSDLIDKTGAVYSHKYAKHVRDRVFEDSEHSACLKKIAFKNTDVIYGEDYTSLKKVLTVMKRQTTQFQLFGGLVCRQPMSVKQIEKFLTVEKDLDKLRGETLGIMMHHINQTNALFGNHPINTTNRLLKQHQEQFIGLLGQMAEPKNE